MQKLEYEVPGISGVVRSYTDDPYVNNILNQLEKSAVSKSVENAQYFLKKLLEWYDQNQMKIQANEYVSNGDTHYKIQSEVRMYIEELVDYNGGEVHEIMNSDNRNPNLDTTKVFIVHGHDESAKQTVARFIERLGLEAIILHEQSSSSKTIIEKIEKYSNVGFGIVIYSPCDVGKSINSGEDSLEPRARQNVIFEHGYLMGRLGRSNVCALVKGKVEIPSDISGIVYTTMDEHNGWEKTILKEMNNIGYEIDVTKWLQL